MKSKQIKRIAATLALSAAFSAVWAQDDTPAKPADQAPQPADQAAKPTDQATKPAGQPDAKSDTAADQDEEAPAVEPLNVLSIGAFGWSFGGNRHKLNQYASSPNGLSINELSLLAPGATFGHFLFRGVPDGDFVTDGRAIMDSGRGSLKFSASQFGYSDPTLFPVGGSTDHQSRVEAAYSLTPDLGLFASYRSIAHDHVFEPPYAPSSVRSDNFAIGVEGHALNGQAGASFDGTTFNDRDGTQPDWTRNRFQAHYGKDLSPTLSVEGKYSRTNIIQHNAPDANIQSYGLDVMFDCGPSTTLFLNVKRDDFNLPVIQNAYVQRRFETDIRMQGQLFKQRLTLGYSHREEERLNADHSYVDVPVWNGFSGRMSGKIDGSVRYVASVNWDHFSKGDITDASDPLAIYWDDKLRAQFRLDGTHGERLAWYAAEIFGLNRNRISDVQIRSYNALLGGNYQLASTTNAFFEVSDQNFAAQGAATPGGYSLDQWFPTGYNIGFGLDRMLSPKASVTLNVNHSFTSYVNPLLLPNGNFHSTQLTAQYRRQIAKDSSLNLTFAPWNYTDQNYWLNSYRATMFAVSYSTKF